MIFSLCVWASGGLIGREEVELRAVLYCSGNLVMCSRIVACLLNISEARNAGIVERVAHAAVSSKTKLCSEFEELSCPSTVLNIFRDFDYNRSVITIAAPLEIIQESIFSACKVAYQVRFPNGVCVCVCVCVWGLVENQILNCSLSAIG